ncbi:MAG: hypothetical protein R3194_08275, partial [Limnobacter sp.]|nr:hypothetical protein [Limnobacter sp.]
MTFESVDLIRSPIAVLTLRSECPLATFEHRWNLVATPSKDSSNNSARLSGRVTNEEDPSSFDTASSELLSDSHRVPVQWEKAQAILARQKAQEQEKIAASNLEAGVENDATSEDSAKEVSQIDLAPNDHSLVNGAAGEAITPNLTDGFAGSEVSARPEVTLPEEPETHAGLSDVAQSGEIVSEPIPDAFDEPSLFDLLSTSDQPIWLAIPVLGLFGILLVAMWLFKKQRMNRSNALALREQPSINTPEETGEVPTDLVTTQQKQFGGSKLRQANNNRTGQMLNSLLDDDVPELVNGPLDEDDMP